MKILEKFHREESIEHLRKRGVKIGDNVDIFSSHIDNGHGFLISIGNNCTITNSTILAHDASTKKELGFSKVGKVSIGNDVFVGHGSIILPGVTIGDRVIIGAGSVIRNNIPSNCVVVGNPANIVCTYDEYINKNKKRLQEVPRYNTFWKNKSKKEKDQMVEEINFIGYDI